MPDINWGGDSSTAPFSSRLDETNGDLILAEDNGGSVVLLEWDGSTWQYRGPVEMNGEDISGVGTLTATDVTVSGTVDAGAVNTVDPELDGRPWTTTSPLTIDVSNYATPQEAANQIPRNPKHQVDLDVGAGNDFSTTDLIIPPIFGQSFNQNGEYSTFRVVGGQPAYTSFNSIAFAGGTGVTLRVRGIEFAGEVPYTNESASLEFYNVDEASVRNSNFAGSAVVGVQSYRSELQINQENEITGTYDHFANVKHNGTITVNKAVANNGFNAVSGNDLNETVWYRGGGHIYHDPQSIAVGGTNGLADSADGAGGATINTRTNTVIEGDGPVLDSYLKDGFEDGQILNRDTRISGSYIADTEIKHSARFRPEWTENFGSPSATAGAAQIPGNQTNDILATPSTHTYGTWEFTTEFQATPTVDQTRIQLIDDGSVKFTLNQRPGTNDVRLISVNGNGTVGTASVSYDADPHNWIVTRDESDNWTVERDGTQLITGTDGSGNESQSFKIDNITDSGLNVSRVDLY